MAEHPLHFTGPEVRAVLAGQKTQTRRLLTPQTARFGSAPRLFWEHANLEKAWVDGKGSGQEYLHVPCHRGDTEELKRLDEVWAAKGQPDHGYDRAFPDCGSCDLCDRMGWRMTSHRLYPRWEPGDRIWVREHHYRHTGVGEPHPVDGFFISPDGDPYQARIYADHPKVGSYLEDASIVSMPSIHMPRWASRLLLEVKAVRIERLQVLSTSDAIAEGIPQCAGEASQLGLIDLSRTHGYEWDNRTTRENFAVLWDSINGKRATWASNPWVAAITFAVERAPRG